MNLTRCINQSNLDFDIPTNSKVGDVITWKGWRATTICENYAAVDEGHTLIILGPENSRGVYLDAFESTNGGKLNEQGEFLIAPDTKLQVIKQTEDETILKVIPSESHHGTYTMEVFN